jgi:hypothetical protein
MEQQIILSYINLGYYKMEDLREYEKLRDIYFNDGETYEDSHQNNEKAKLLLNGIYHIEEVYEDIREDHDDERHWFQQTYIRRGLDGLLATHHLTSHYFYDSAYRDVRTLIEIILILNYMNRNKIETAIHFLKQEREILLSDIELGSLKWSKKELYSEDEIHEMLSTEKERLKDENSDLMEFYDFFSNRNVHPIRTDSIKNNRTYQSHEDDQLLNWQVDILRALIIQMVKIYSDTDDLRYVVNELEPLEDLIVENHGTAKFLDHLTDSFPYSQ